MTNHERKERKNGGVKLIMWLTVVVIVLSLLSQQFPAVAENTVNSGSLTGVVICSSLSVRVAPDTRADRIVSLKNGNMVEIENVFDEWLEIQLSSIGAGEGTGFILKRHVRILPYYYTLPEDAILWADPFGSGLANGEKVKGSTVLVLAETSDWYVVQTRESTAGSSFIKKNGQNSVNNNTTIVSPSFSRAVVIAPKSLAVYLDSSDDSRVIAYLHPGDVVEITKSGEYFTGIKFTLEGQTTECWVHTKWLKEIYE